MAEIPTLDTSGIPAAPVTPGTGTTPVTTTPAEITLEQIKAHPEYQKLRGEYTRLTQYVGPRKELIDYLEEDVGAAEMLERRLQERGIIPTAATPTPGAPPIQGVSAPTPQDPVLAKMAADLQAAKGELAEIQAERARQFREGEWGKTESGFQKIMGRAMSEDEKGRTFDYLKRTGAGDLWSSALAVFHNEFMNRAVQLHAEGLTKAADEARRMATEGSPNAGTRPQVDFAKANLDELRRQARAAAGLSGEETRYNPDVTRFPG